MKKTKIFIGLLIWIAGLTFLYGALWNRYPNFFPSPPQKLNDWIAFHFFSGFDIEAKTDLVILVFSLCASCLLTFVVWVTSKFFKKIIP